jgi:uncharacterized Zn finger protein (UPF0148 family)
MTMNPPCEHCGGPTCTYEGEVYCPDCTYYDALELAAEADEEARLERTVIYAAWDDTPADPPW